MLLARSQLSFDDSGLLDMADDSVVATDLISSGGFSGFECRDFDDSGGGNKLYVCNTESKRQYSNEM